MSKPRMLHRHVALFTSGLYQTNSTVFVAPNDVFVVDPCWLPNEVLAIKDYVDSIKRHRKVNLIFTHGDYDHIVGYGAFPGARVIAARQFSAPALQQKNLAAARKWDMEHYVERPWQLEFPTVDINISTDGKAMHFSGTVLTFYLAPGHTQDGIFIVFEPAGIFIAGDYLSDVEFPFVEDIAKYRRTMHKVDRVLRSHVIKHMIPGHGTVANGIAAIKSRGEASLEYLDDLENPDMLRQEAVSSKYQRRYKFWPGLRDIYKQQYESFPAIDNDHEKETAD